MDEQLNTDTPVTASSGGLSVEKVFEGEEFAVPAIKFTIRSEESETVTFRLVDFIPEEFPMDSVGFHPGYENENWTAYKDHRVEFERVIEPDEEIVTVYGIRLSETDGVDGFLGDPEIYEIGTVGEGTDDSGIDASAVDENMIGDIVSEESSQLVRDVISGRADSLPGLGEDDDAPDADETDPLAEAGESPETDPLAEADEPSETDSLAEADEPSETDPVAGANEASETASLAEADEPSETDPLTGADEPSEADQPTPATDSDEADPLAELRSDETSSDETKTESTDMTPENQTDPLADRTATESTTETTDAEPEGIEDEPTALGSATQDEPAESPGGAAGEQSIAAALADEIRAGRVSDADLRVLRDELEFDAPESTNVRLRHLQSRVEDLSAYTGALEEFIDNQGTAEQLIEEFDRKVDSVDDQLEELEGAVGTDEEVRDRLDELEADLDSFADHEAFEQLDGDVERLQAEVEELSEIEEDVAAIGDVNDEVEALRTRATEIEELVGANTQDVTELANDVEHFEAELDSVSDVETDLDALGEEVDSVSRDVDDLDGRLVERIESVQADVEDIHAELEELQTWRSQLSTVFGGQTE